MFLVNVSFIFDFQLTKEYLDTISKVSDGWELSMSFTEDSGDEYLQSKQSTHGTTQRDLINWVQARFTRWNRRNGSHGRLINQRKRPVLPQKIMIAQMAKTPTMQTREMCQWWSWKKEMAPEFTVKGVLVCPMQCHKMARHFIHKHSSKSSCFSFKVKGNRKLHFDLIRNKGNRAHNTEVWKPGSGTLEKTNWETC